MSTNRIGGDFNSDAVEAFRAAYASQFLTPEQQDTDDRTGLPSNTVSLTSPWIEHTGLWKYPSGKGPEDDLKAPFDPNNYFTKEEEEGVELSSLSPEELDQYLDSLSDDELFALNEELNGSDEDGDSIMTDEEIDALIDELTNGDD